MSDQPLPLVLCVLDGWGERPNDHANTVALAQTPHHDRLRKECPHLLLRTDGSHVGLLDGYPGNSEVGHLHLGIGRRFRHALIQINQSIESGSLFRSRPWVDAISRVQQTGGRVHIVGLLSPGGVHSHSDHTEAVARWLTSHNLECSIHAITDARDEVVGRAWGNMKALTQKVPDVRVESTVGRYFAMDRNNNINRTNAALNLMTLGEGTPFADLDDLKPQIDALLTTKTEEFLPPFVRQGFTGINASTDLTIVMNFRPDRARQLVSGLEQKGLHLLTTYRFTPTQQSPHLFNHDTITYSVGEAIANAGRSQFRIAETEKYAHVTYFFSAYRDKPFPREERVLIESPNVETFDQAPRMSAEPITDHLTNRILQRTDDFYLVNYANLDMVGHTGNIDACIEAAQFTDAQLGRLIGACESVGARLLVVADHGNADQLQTESGAPHTWHTQAPVMAIGMGFARTAPLHNDYIPSLIDVAPTILTALDIPKPTTMTGLPLFVP